MTRRYMVWIDVNGFTRLSYVNQTASGTTVQTQLVALSNADVLSSVDNTFVTGAVSPPGATFQNVADVAILTYTTAGGNLVDITLPAPLASIFLADQVTVDVTKITALNTAVIGTVTDAGGNVVTAYVGGTRQRQRKDLY